MVIHSTLIDLECLSWDLIKRTRSLFDRFNCTGMISARVWGATTLQRKLIPELASYSTGIAGIQDFQSEM